MKKIVYYGVILCMIFSVGFGQTDSVQVKSESAPPIETAVQNESGSTINEIIEVESGSGNLSIITVPDSAHVKLDNIMIEGVTPIKIYDIPAGVHTIAVRKKDYFLVKTSVSIEDDTEKEIKFELNKQSSTVKEIKPPVKEKTASNVEIETGKDDKAFEPFDSEMEIENPVSVEKVASVKDSLREETASGKVDSSQVVLEFNHKKSRPLNSANAINETVPVPEPEVKRDRMGSFMDKFVIGMFVALGLMVSVMELSEK